MLRFGTDGVRGLANAELTPELVLALGRAAARSWPALPGATGGSSLGGTPAAPARCCRPRYRPGWRARASTWSMSGVLATPAVAYLSAGAAGAGGGHLRVAQPASGTTASSSSPPGLQAARRAEEALEAELEALFAQPERPLGADPLPLPGRSSPDPDALGRYERHVLAACEGRRLGGLRVALDCANGAAFQSAPAVFEAAAPSWSTSWPSSPTARTSTTTAAPPTPAGWPRRSIGTGRPRVGLRWRRRPGDRRRRRGNVVDGDRLLALFATDLSSRRLLAGGDRRGDGHDQPRLPPGHGGGRA